MNVESDIIKLENEFNNTYKYLLLPLFLTKRYIKNYWTYFI